MSDRIVILEALTSIIATLQVVVLILVLLIIGLAVSGCAFSRVSEDGKSARFYGWGKFKTTDGAEIESAPPIKIGDLKKP